MLSSIDKNPGRKDLLVFGFALPVLFGVLGYALAARTHLPAVAAAVWAVGACLTALFVAVPVLRRPIYVGYRYAVFPIGWTVLHLLLAVLFFVVVTPVGLVRRLLGRDPLERRFDRTASSYWVERGPPAALDRYFRPY